MTGFPTDHSYTLPAACLEQRGRVMSETKYSFNPIGFVHSPLKERQEAPKQGSEGAPDAWLEVNPTVAEGLDGLAVSDEIIVITWLHQAHRDILKLHPRGDEAIPLAGVFATRSPDRPNPLGLHEVTVLEIDGNRLKVGPIEAIEGTPMEIRILLLWRWRRNTITGHGELSRDARLLSPGLIRQVV
jgi:tRNA-Thr(GGU) m(6)t(6)A37 methyltransferase TsaA